MDGNVGLTEIDLALVAFIKDTIKMSTGVTLNVLPRFPDQDLLDRSLPCVSFTNYDQRGRNITNRGQMLVSTDNINGVATFVSSPNRYYLYYQIDFWSNFQQDINEMIGKWLTKLNNFDTLAVTDSLGNARDMEMSLVQFANMDSGKDNDRLFRRTYSYKIGAEFWGDTIEVPILTQKVNINKISIGGND